MSIRRKLLLAIPLALLVVVGGCKVDTINYFPPHPAQVRVINLMPEPASLDVSIGGAPAFSALTFQTLTGYQSYENKTTNFSVAVTGSATPLLNFSYPLAGEQPYTVVLMGTLANPSATLLAEVPNAPTNGNIQLSVFNAAINNGSMDIYVTAPGADITQLNPNYFNVRYNGVSLNLAFPPGTYQIQICEQGTKTVIYDSGGSVLQPNIALTLLAYTRGSSALVNAAVIESKGGGAVLNTIFAFVKAINAGTGTTTVDLLQGTTKQISAVAYANASPYQQVPQGATTLNFEASSAPGTPIASVPAALAPATDTSTFVTGPAGALQAYTLNDMNLPPVGSNVRLRFVNTSWNSNPVNVSVNNVAQASNVAFPNASGYVQIASGTFPITFTDAVTGAVVLQLDNVNLTTVGTYTVYAIGPAGALGGFVTQDD
jgi:hypothetical protein